MPSRRRFTVSRLRRERRSTSYRRRSSGFGFSANYTKVESSVTFDPSLSAQVFNVEGPDRTSADLVAFYEKGPVQLRVAP